MPKLTIEYEIQKHALGMNIPKVTVSVDGKQVGLIDRLTFAANKDNTLPRFSASVNSDPGVLASSVGDTLRASEEALRPFLQGPSFDEKIERIEKLSDILHNSPNTLTESRVQLCRVKRLPRNFSQATPEERNEMNPVDGWNAVVIADSGKALSKDAEPVLRSNSFFDPDLEVVIDLLLAHVTERAAKFSRDAEEKVRQIRSIQET